MVVLIYKFLFDFYKLFVHIALNFIILLLFGWFKEKFVTIIIIFGQLFLIFREILIFLIFLNGAFLLNTFIRPKQMLFLL